MKNWTLIGIGTEKYHWNIKDGVIELASDEATAADYAAVRNRVSVDVFRGKKVQLTAQLLAKDCHSVGLWLRANTDELMVSDAMYDRLIKGSCDWTTQSLVIEVPSEAKILTYGVWMIGNGSCSMKQDELKIIQSDGMPTTHRIYEQIAPRKWTAKSET